MKCIMNHISTGEDEVIVNYLAMTPEIERIVNFIKGEQTRLAGWKDKEQKVIDIKSILYIETVDGNTFAYTESDVLKLDYTLAKLEQQLNDIKFFRCSKSMIINIDKVDSLRSLPSNRIDAQMVNGEHIIISRTYASDFRRILKKGVQQGSVRIFGKELKAAKEEILSQVGYMPSEAMFYPDMKVKNVIKMAADIRKLDCKEEAAMLCERLKVDTEKKINELSLGNRKKVSIVCAMQHKPKLFVFDEPTSGLDPLMQTEFFKLIREYVEKGATCMLSTHVLSEVKNYCKNVAIMREGRLIKVDTVAEITKTNAKRIKMIRDGKQENFLYQGDLNRIADELAGHNIEDILIEDPSLDEIFMHYYEK